jgi:hypothetical protein
MVLDPKPRDNLDMRNESVFYRIYTQDIPAHRKRVVRILKKHGFQDFTLFPGVGYWQGGKERSLIIEVVIEGSGKDTAIKSAAKEIGSKNGRAGQQAMLLVRNPVKRSFFLKGRDYASYAEGAVAAQVGDPWLMPEPPGPYRGRILFACGDWWRLLPEGAEKVRGRMLVRDTATQY